MTFMPTEFSQKYQGMACFPVLVLFYNLNFMKYTFFFFTLSVRLHIKRMKTTLNCC